MNPSSRSGRSHFQEQEEFRVQRAVVARRGVVGREHLLDQARDVVGHAGDEPQLLVTDAEALQIGRVGAGVVRVLIRRLARGVDESVTMKPGRRSRHPWPLPGRPRTGPRTRSPAGLPPPRSCPRRRAVALRADAQRWTCPLDPR